MEEGIAVGDTILLIVIGSAATGGHLLLLYNLCWTLLCLHQAVHLTVVRGPQAVGEEGRLLGPLTGVVRHSRVCLETVTVLGDLGSLEAQEPTHCSDPQRYLIPYVPE